MSNVKIPRKSTELLNKKLFDERIASSYDVAGRIFSGLFDKMGNDKNIMGIAFISSYGQVLSVEVATEEFFENNTRAVLSMGILNNAAAVMFISNGDIKPEREDLTAKYMYALKCVNINVLDHLYKDDHKRIRSCRNEFNYFVDMVDDYDYKDIKIGEPLDIEQYKRNIRIKVKTDANYSIGRGGYVEAVLKIASSIQKQDKEQIHVLCLDKEDKPICSSIVSIGTLNETMCTPREIYKLPLLQTGTEKIVLLHNHPSGSVLPSSHDFDTTYRISQVGAMLGIELKEHFVVPAFSNKLVKISDFETVERPLMIHRELEKFEIKPVDRESISTVVEKEINGPEELER